MTDPRLLPSACHDGIGTPDCIAFAAQYLACTCPCQRFAYCVATASRNTRFQAARYGPWVGLAPADRASFAWRLPSLDHLVGTAKERQRNCDAEEFRGLEIQDEHILVRTLNR